MIEANFEGAGRWRYSLLTQYLHMWVGRVGIYPMLRSLGESWEGAEHGQS